MFHFSLTPEIGRIPQGYLSQSMLLIYSDSKLKVPLMEQGHWESPDVSFLVNHLEGLPLILVYMSTHAHTHIPTHIPPHTPPKHVCLMMTTLQMDTYGGKNFQQEFKSTITFIQFILPLVLHFEEWLEYHQYFIYSCSIPALRKSSCSTALTPFGLRMQNLGLNSLGSNSSSFIHKQLNAGQISCLIGLL